MDMTFAEKILAENAGEKRVEPGQIVTVRPDHLLMHDNAAGIIQKIPDELREYGVCNKSLPIIVLDHVIPAASEKIAANHQRIREFVKTYGLPHFFDAGFEPAAHSTCGGFDLSGCSFGIGRVPGRGIQVPAALFCSCV